MHDCVKHRIARARVLSVLGCLEEALEDIQIALAEGGQVSRG